VYSTICVLQEELIERGRRENNHLKVFPCKLRILPQYIFNSRDPIIMGVSVEAGFLSNGTPICVPDKEVRLGCVLLVQVYKSIQQTDTYSYSYVMYCMVILLKVMAVVFSAIYSLQCLG